VFNFKIKSFGISSEVINVKYNRIFHFFWLKMKEFPLEELCKGNNQEILKHKY